jgi:glycosyltransferase involved in cell wall biosynthesis
MKPLRVLELVASSRGGGAVHVRDLVQSLPAGTFDLQVAMPEDGGSIGRAEFESIGIPFHNIAIAQGISLRALGQIRSLASSVDILHVHGSRAALFGRLTAQFLGHKRPRVAFTIHGFAAPHYAWPRRRILLLVEQALAGVTDAWICVSSAEQQSLAASHIAQPHRTHIIHNGIHAARFAPSVGDRRAVRESLGLSDEAVVVTTVCRLYRPRDLPSLLTAFRQLVDAGFGGHLLIVGDGPLRSMVEQQISHLMLQPVVHLLGMRRDVPQILSASDLFVLSSGGWEGLPLTVLEAMAAQLPVVASDVGGTREAVVDGETGYLVAPGDVGSLARYLAELANNRAAATAMGARGRHRVEQSFTLDRMVRETAELYRALAGQDDVSKV